jgi:tetratricopeptide (TPR) repeat protein
MQRTAKAAATHTAAPTGARTRSYALPCVLLVIGVFLLYTGSYRYPLVFDDRLFNPVELPDMAVACGVLRNRCLTYTTWGLTYLAVGMDVFWFRVGNVVCHALVALALFFFLDELFEAVRQQSPENPGEDPRARNRLLAFCGAVLFAVHPVTVYGVAYLVQRGTVMATLFSLLALVAIVRALEGKGRHWLWASALLCVAALLSKEHAIMLPAIAFAVALLLGKRILGSWLERLLLAGAVIVVAAVIIDRLASIIGTVPEYFTRELAEIKDTGESTFDPRQGYLSSVVTQTVLFYKYLLLWLVPYPGWMSVDLRAPIADGPLAWPWVLGVPAYLAWGIVAAILVFRRGTTGLLGLAMAFPWLLFFTEFVTSRIQEPLVLYRSYLWMAGLPIALPFLARRLSARAVVIGCAVIALALGAAMRERLGTFENHLKLWDDVVRKNTDLTNYFVDRGYTNRAATLMHMGRFDEALPDIEMSIKLNPRNSHAYVNRAIVLRQKGDDGRALADLEKAVKLDPEFAEAHSELCASLIKVNQHARALPSCDEALRLVPQLPNALINRAVIHTRSKRYQEALVDLDAFLKYGPNHGIARFNRAMIYRELGRTADSEADLRVSCRAGFGPACKKLPPTPPPKPLPLLKR